MSVWMSVRSRGGAARFAGGAARFAGGGAALWACCLCSSIPIHARTLLELRRRRRRPAAAYSGAAAGAPVAAVRRASSNANARRIRSVVDTPAV